MTDNEIIKALECCKNADCQNCPRWSEEWYSGMCNDFLSDVLDLINRQKAEIERLQGEVKEKTETIDFLKNQAVGWSIDFCNLKAKLKSAKSEARKEFAERLKENTVTVKIGKQTCKVITVEGIDNLFLDFTKMVGGD